MDENKKRMAMVVMEKIRTSDTKRLNRMIVEQCGEELAQFFLEYSAGLISRDPERILENTASVMLLGYLVAKNERANIFDDTTFEQLIATQAPAEA